MKFFESNYPELKDIWKNIEAKKAILDGEIVIFRKGKPDFPSLQTREHVDEATRIELLSKIMPATFIVFDILHLDEKDLIELPLIERKKILEKVIKESNRILFSRYVIGKGKKFFQEIKKKGLEGLMAKRLQSKYEIGKRSKDWLKIKYLKTLDCVIVGFTKGSGWREKYFGALVLGCYYQGKLRYVGRVGTGWEEKDFEELTSKLQELKTDRCPFEENPKFPSDLEVTWIKPKLICEVKFMNLSKDLIMRAPAYIRLREDKLPKDCTLEI